MVYTKLLLVISVMVVVKFGKRGAKVYFDSFYLYFFGKKTADRQVETQIAGISGHIQPPDFKNPAVLLYLFYQIFGFFYEA